MVAAQRPGIPGQKELMESVVRVTTAPRRVSPKHTVSLEPTWNPELMVRFLMFVSQETKLLNFHILFRLLRYENNCFIFIPAPETELKSRPGKFP